MPGHGRDQQHPGPAVPGRAETQQPPERRAQHHFLADRAGGADLHAIEPEGFTRQAQPVAQGGFQHQGKFTHAGGVRGPVRCGGDIGIGHARLLRMAHGEVGRWPEMGGRAADDRLRMEIPF
jgi:hypothetical protein